jgi:hypothetical protein
MRAICLAAMWAALSAPLAVDPPAAPKAALTGPPTVAVGSMAVIKTEGSVGKSFRWLVLPKESESWFLPVYVDGPGATKVQAGILVPAAQGTVYVTYIATSADASDVFTLTINPGAAPNPPPQPPPDGTNPYKPVAEHQEVAKPLLSFHLPRADATAIASCYAKLAADSGPGTSIQTTGQLRTALVQRYKALGFAGKYAATFGAAADKAFGATLGTDPNVELELGVRDFLNTMAWAAWETGK